MCSRCTCSVSVPSNVAGLPVHAGLEPKTVLLNLDSGGSTYAGLLICVRRPLEIPVVVRRPVHLFGIAEHGTPCTLVLQKYTSAMSTDVVWDRSYMQLGFTGCRPRADLVHVGCRSRCYGQSICTMRSLSHVGLNHCPMYLSTISLATCAKNTMHLSIVVFPTSCILWGLPPPMKHHVCSSGLGLLPSNHHIEPLS